MRGEQGRGHSHLGVEGAKLLKVLLGHPHNGAISVPALREAVRLDGRRDLLLLLLLLLPLLLLLLILVLAVLVVVAVAHANLHVTILHSL